MKHYKVVLSKFLFLGSTNWWQRKFKTLFRNSDSSPKLRWYFDYLHVYIFNVLVVYHAFLSCKLISLRLHASMSSGTLLSSCKATERIKLTKSLCYIEKSKLTKYIFKPRDTNKNTNKSNCWIKKEKATEKLAEVFTHSYKKAL